MNKAIYFIFLYLFISCSSNEEESTQEKVCRCNQLYFDLNDFHDELVEEGMEPVDAKKKAKEKYPEFEECAEFEHEIGTDKFYEMIPNCH